MNLNVLASEIRNLDSSLAKHAASAVNTSLSIRNWHAPFTKSKPPCATKS
jgi:hypothetical protein